MLVTATYFIIHYILDCFFLSKTPIKFYLLPILCLPYFWLCAIRLCDYANMYQIGDLLTHFFLLSFIFTPYLLVKKKINQIHILFHFFPLIIYFATLLGYDSLLFHSLHILFLSHYFMWYYYVTYDKGRSFVRTFTMNFAGVHIVLIILGILYIN